MIRKLIKPTAAAAAIAALISGSVLTTVPAVAADAPALSQLVCQSVVRRLLRLAVHAMNFVTSLIVT